MDIAVPLLTVVLCCVGLAGVILPLLPGTTLILAAMVIHKLLLPGALAWIPFIWIGLIWALSILADVGGVVLGTRLGGGGKWGMTGAGIGTMIGMFFSLRALFFGSLIGAIAAEKWVAGRSDAAALKAGVGAAVGFVLSTIIRLACGLAMIGVFALALRVG